MRPIQICLLLAAILIFHLPSMSVQGAEPTQVIHAPRVSLAMQDVEPAAVFAAIEQQAGITLTAAPRDLWRQKDWPRVTLRLDDVPFMEAIATACEMVGVYVERGPNNSLLIMDHNNPAGIPAKERYRERAVKGPIMLLGSAIQFSDGPHVITSVYHEPGTRLYSVAREPTLTNVVDAEGRNLRVRPRPAGGPFGSVTYASTAWGSGWSAGLDAPAGRPVKHLQRVEGSYSVTLVTASKRIEVPRIDQQQDVRVSLPEHELRIDRLTTDPNAPDQFLVHCQVVRQQGISEQAWSKTIFSLRTVIFGLSDAEELPLVYRGYSTAGGNSNGYLFILRFARRDPDRNLPILSDAWRAAWPEPELPGDPVTLWFDAPTQTVTIDVPFVFQNIPVRQPQQPPGLP